MLVISNFKGSSYFSSDIERFGTNQPELRQKLIYNKLSQYKDKYTILIPCIELSKESLSELKIHDNDYLDFLEKVYDNFLELRDDDYNNSDGIIPHHFSKNKSCLKILPLWRQLGYYCDDFMTPINSDTYTLSIESANNCYVAVDMLQKWDKIYCLNTNPGHHARRDGCSGYCYINNAYVCVSRLIDQKRVVVIDLDYHAGTHEIYKNDHRVMSISIHADPKYEYPTFSGHECENTEYNYNIIFPKKATWNEYSICLNQAMDLIKKYDPDIVIVPFGGDTFYNDPDASKLYGCGLQLDDYIKMGQEINRLNKKTIVTQEGGYYMEKMPDIVDNFLTGLLG